MKSKGSPKKRSGKTYAEGEEEDFTMMAREGEVPVYRADSFSKIAYIQNGITKDDVDDFKLKAGLDYESLARLLHVTKATLFNRQGRRFDKQLSERLVLLEDLYSYGYSVMGAAKFNLWMKADNVALQKRPLDLADTLYGIQEIRALVGRIDYGVYS
jgi:uncharacterized protein (DUF2384 family)